MATTLQFGKRCLRFVATNESSRTCERREASVRLGGLLDRTGSGAYRFFMKTVGNVLELVSGMPAGLRTSDTRPARST